MADRLLLGDSYQLALQRLLSMEKKINRNSEFGRMYVAFMADYENLGHMKRLSPTELRGTEREIYYLPHHGVLRQNNGSTKLRVVFDGSAASSNGVSLNDTLLIGSRLQDTLWTILLRFRSFKIAMCADIEKMYRQILIDPAQTSLQRILWRTSPSDPISHYALLTVTYGTSSAPFLAIRALLKIADDCQRTHPNVSKVIRENFYVDDVLTGADTEEEAANIKNQLMERLKARGCILRKWRSNSCNLRDSNDVAQITEEDRAEQILGLYWDAATDVFSFKDVNITDNKYTKRSVLSIASRLFDPIGWLTPFTVSVKIFMQRLWLKKMLWDEKLSPDLQDAWNSIQNQFHSISDIRIPRYVDNFKGDYQIHGFSDASELAYSAAIYIRRQTNDHITTTLLTSKSKVAPIQQASLPD